MKEAEYKVINLKYEYPGIKGDVKWAVVTDLDQKEMLNKYADDLGEYMPYVVITSEQGEAFRQYKNNESKYEMRRIRHETFLGYEEGMTENAYDIVAHDDPEEIIVKREQRKMFMTVIEQLPPAQKRRCTLYYYGGIGKKEIAHLEGVSQQMVSISINDGLKNIRRLMKYSRELSKLY